MADLLTAPDEYFWYYPFELDDYDSAEHQTESFLRELSRLLHSATLIEARQDLLWRRLTCTLEEANSATFGPRLAKLAPLGRHHIRIYRSGPLISGGSDS